MAKKYFKLSSDLNHLINHFHYNSANDLGECMASIRDLNPATEEEWVDWYFKNIQTQEDLKEYADLIYKEHTKYCLFHKIDAPMIYEYLCDLTGACTWKGYTKEKGAFEYIAEKLKVTVFPSGQTMDAVDMVDGTAQDEKGRQWLISVKPMSFFEKRSAWDLNISRVIRLLLKKDELYCGLILICYNKDGFSHTIIQNPRLVHVTIDGKLTSCLMSN